MKHRDWTTRQVKGEGGAKVTLKVERVKCIECGFITRVLPDCLTRFKHYDKRIIDGVLDGTITSDDLEYEDYPSEYTMERWKKQVTKEKVK